MLQWKIVRHQLNLITEEEAQTLAMFICDKYYKILKERSSFGFLNYNYTENLDSKKVFSL